MPLTRFTQTEPKEIFVHCNIANQVSLTDINFLLILNYGISDSFGFVGRENKGIFQRLM